MRAPIVFLLPLLCSTAGFAADPALDAVFQRMDKASATFKGFTADLEKIDRTGGSLLEATDKSVGTIAVRKSGPHNVQALEIFVTQNGEPDGGEMEFSATRFSVYRPKANTVTHYDFGKKYRGIEEAALALLGGSSKDLLQDYKVAYAGPEAINGQPTTRLALEPKDPQLAQMFPKMDVWISDASGIAVQQKFREKGDIDYHIQTYSNMQFGPVSDSQVKMNLPKTVKHEYPK
jgi:outer membrane lipoprotein-sorting protein